MDRQQIIDHYRRQPQVSVLIIGAGINGIGVFRDLALQGVDVLLVDKQDFCAGVSAASSRQAHGGLRYLEHGDFRLVRESLLERNRLLQNAPHAVELLQTTIPVFSWFSGLLNAPLKFLGLLQRPSARGYIVVKLGMMLYDWFTRRNRATPTHTMLTRQQALQRHSHLRPNVVGAASYYDCLMPQAERIGLEQVLDAEAANPACHALNYCAVVGGGGNSVALRDVLTGETFSVQPRLVINAGGAWIDRVNGALARSTRFIGGTKGSHIVVENSALRAAVNNACIFFENRDGRLAIFMPWRDKVVIGATDLRWDQPDDTVCSEEEIEYFLQFTDHILPGLKVERSQIVFHFCGVRPLPASEVEFVGLVTRDHRLAVLEPDDTIRFPIYNLIGGKWTTFRAFAEQTTDQALAFLGQRRRASTEDLPIGGGAGYPRTPEARAQWLQRVAGSTGLGIERLGDLFERYGTRAEAVARFIQAGPDQPIDGLPAYSRLEMQFVARCEKVEHLDDVLLRRSWIAMLGLINGPALVDLAGAVGEALGWSAARVQDEIERTRALLITRHGVPAGRISE
jgi:glycerol-3-phosphate dehydrogenase